MQIEAQMQIQSKFGAVRLSEGHEQGVHADMKFRNTKSLCGNSRSNKYLLQQNQFHIERMQK